MEDPKDSSTEESKQIVTPKAQLDSLQSEVKSTNQRITLNEIKGLITALKTEVAALQSTVTQNDREIDALQIEMAKPQRPWYRDVATIVAVIALLFSFGTTVVSIYRTRQQDIRDARTELRSHLQRLSVLAKENAELKNTQDEEIRAGLSGILGNEYRLTAQQSAEVIDNIPPSYMSSAEYIAVANALIVSSSPDVARGLLKRAIDTSKNPDDKLGAYRLYAALLFSSGDFEEGRKMYQEALNISNSYPPSLVPNSKEIRITQAELAWAATEARWRQCSQAQAHLENALKFLSNLPPSNNKETLLQETTKVQEEVRGCQ